MTPHSSYNPPDARTDAREQAEQEKQEQRVNAVMREMEQHGENLATWANRLATMLLAVFSTASLLSLSLAAFNTFMAQLTVKHFDIPDALSVLLNLLLVLAMDMAMFYAASVIRAVGSAVGSAGGAWREIIVHVIVMVTASLLETTTYIYLVVQYDRPTNAWLWGIGIGRGIAAPLFATYLSLARKLPVAPRDIAYYVALLSGRGVVHDVAVLAADRHAPLHQKVGIYTAAATMAAAEYAKFSRIIAAVEKSVALAAPQAKRQEEPQPVEPQPVEPQQPAPPTTPIPFPTQRPQPARPQPQRHEEAPALAPAATTARMSRRGLGRNAIGRRDEGAASRSDRRTAPTDPRDPDDDEPADDRAEDRADERKLTERQADRVDLRRRREEAARRILADDPQITTRALARRIAIATQNSCSETSARSIREVITTEDTAEEDEEVKRN